MTMAATQCGHKGGATDALGLHDGGRAAQSGRSAWRGHDIWSRPDLDLVQSHAYSAFGQLGGDFKQAGRVDRAIDRYYEGYMARYGRPVLIAEYGGHWMRNPADTLDAELHAGIWTSLTTHMAGCTGFWWWLHIHFADKYAHYRAAARFMAGEDRRGQNLRQTSLPVQSPHGYLRARALKNDRTAAVWVYHPSIVRSLDRARAIEGARLDVPDMAEGRYRVEFWNTTTGAVVARTELAADGHTLRIELPTVPGDLAVKIRPAR